MGLKESRDMESLFSWIKKFTDKKMRPTIQKYFLKNKKNLTKNVYELEFEWENEINVIPWQFITFMIEWIWARAYSILEKDWKIKFVFWVREAKDLFHLDEIQKLKNISKNFDFVVYLSQEENQSFKKWYILEEIKNSKEFEEAYICWSPKMVDDAKKELLKNWFDEKNIFEEKY